MGLGVGTRLVLDAGSQLGFGGRQQKQFVVLGQSSLALVSGFSQTLALSPR